MACWSFEHGWPRIRSGKCKTLPLSVAPRSATPYEAKQALWKLPNFTPPLTVSMAPFGDGAREGVFLHIVVTHMLSDGYTLVPIIADLSQLIARVEQIPPIPPPLPPLASSFIVLERRIFRTIRDDVLSNDAVTQEPVGRTQRACRRDGATIMVTLPEPVVSAIRQAARKLAVSDEVVMLTALGVTFARFENKATVPLTIIAPQRDAVGETDMIGLFADIRLLKVNTEGFSYAGTAFWLHHVVKERLWQAPPIQTQFEVPLINFEWTDMEPRHGFSQDIHPRSGNEQLSNPIKVAVDQPDPGSWRMRTAFDQAIYGHEDRTRFFDIFKHSLHMLFEDPLALVDAETNQMSSAEAVATV